MLFILSILQILLLTTMTMKNFLEISKAEQSQKKNLFSVQNVDKSSAQMPSSATIVEEKFQEQKSVQNAKLKTMQVQSFVKIVGQGFKGEI